MSPERHHWKPAVQAAAVNVENAPRHPPVTGQQRAHTPPSVSTMSSYHWMDASL